LGHVDTSLPSDLSAPSASANHSLNALLTIAQLMTGFGSCYEFRRQIGQQAATDFAHHLNAYLQTN
jgi:hypothetical protein